MCDNAYVYLGLKYNSGWDLSTQSLECIHLTLLCKIPNDQLAMFSHTRILGGAHTGS